MDTQLDSYDCDICILNELKQNMKGICNIYAKLITTSHSQEITKQSHVTENHILPTFNS